MRHSLRALLEGIIDYAGLFPPSALPLDEAIRNYARYRKDDDSWMLARFICPAGSLKESTPLFAAALSTGLTPTLSVLGQGGKTSAEFVLGVHADWEAVSLFAGEHAERIRIDAFESRLPPKVVEGPPEGIAGIVCAVSVMINKRLVQLAEECHVQPVAVTSWYEIVPGSEVRPHWKQSHWERTIEALAFGAIASQSYSRAPGFKLRCGGLDASAFPSPKKVAFTIAACRDAKIPLKFTAGLHHPIRHFNSGVQTHMHGFINVFVAGVLAHARGLSEERIRPIIVDEDAASFVFDDAGVRWKDHRATTEEIVQARQEFVTSFGSCSFDEPRDDLRSLGWMP